MFCQLSKFRWCKISSHWTSNWLIDSHPQVNYYPLKWVKMDLEQLGAHAWAVGTVAIMYRENHPNCRIRNCSNVEDATANRRNTWPLVICPEPISLKPPTRPPKNYPTQLKGTSRKQLIWFPNNHPKLRTFLLLAILPKQYNKISNLNIAPIPSTLPIYHHQLHLHLINHYFLQNNQQLIRKYQYRENLQSHPVSIPWQNTNP